KASPLLGRGRASQRGAAEAGAGKREGDAAIPVSALLGREQGAQWAPTQSLAFVLADHPADEPAAPGADQVEGMIGGRRLRGAVGFEAHRARVLTAQLAQR